MVLISPSRLNAQKALRTDGDNVMEIDTLVLNRIDISTAENGQRVP